MKKKSLEGILDLSEHILCSQEVLGEAFEAQIGDINVRILFPRILELKRNTSNVLENYRLIEPDDITLRTGSDKAIDLGQIVAYPEIKAAVKYVFIKTTCEEQEKANTVDKLYECAGKWVKAFVSYTELISKSNTYRDYNYEYESFNPLTIAGEHRETTIKLFANFYSDSNVLKMKDINEALKFASSGKELHFAYQMLLNAYKAKHICNNRQAVMDVCSALEFAVCENIESFCKQKEIKVGIILDKYRSLRERIGLLYKISNAPSINYNDYITTPRNDLMHNKIPNIDDATTDRLIQKAEELIKYCVHEMY